MSPSPTGTIEGTPEGGRVRFERTLAYPIEEVWAAITEPDRLGDWWPPMAAKLTVDLREGGRIVFEWPDVDFPTMEFTITRLQRPTLLEHTHTGPGSWMRWELEATDAGTLLIATYSVPDLDLAIGRGDVVGMHYSLDRLEPALAGSPVAWDNDAFGELVAAYDDAGADVTRG
ncbi:SRPBCC family protein [Micrococcaceae bacterium RIT802]|nr:SRPBCC family protein [Micrococcaceae bacterium RIT 802]